MLSRIVWCRELETLKEQLTQVEGCALKAEVSLEQKERALLEVGKRARLSGPLQESVAQLNQDLQSERVRAEGEHARAELAREALEQRLHERDLKIVSLEAQQTSLVYCSSLSSPLASRTSPSSPSP